MLFHTTIPKRKTYPPVGENPWGDQSILRTIAFVSLDKQIGRRQGACKSNHIFC